jgi:hypothetical protein
VPSLRLDGPPPQRRRMKYALAHPTELTNSLRWYIDKRDIAGDKFYMALGVLPLYKIRSLMREYLLLADTVEELVLLLETKLYGPH